MSDWVVQKLQNFEKQMWDCEYMIDTLALDGWAAND